VVVEQEHILVQHPEVLVVLVVVVELVQELHLVDPETLHQLHLHKEILVGLDLMIHLHHLVVGAVEEQLLLVVLLLVPVLVVEVEQDLKFLLVVHQQQHNQ
jgi:hypothetical protein